MKKTVLFVTALLAFFALKGEDVPPSAVVRKWQKMTKLPGSEGMSTMIIYDNKGRKRVRMLASITRLNSSGDTEKKLIRFLAPSEVKGTGFLTYDYERRDDDRWLFMPALRKTRRIISSEKSKNFMGSEFSYGEMSFPLIEDFRYRYLERVKLSGVDCLVVEIVPVNEDIVDDYGFSKKISFYSVKDNILKKVIYYDPAGSLHRELIVRDV